MIPLRATTPRILATLAAITWMAMMPLACADDGDGDGSGGQGNSGSGASGNTGDCGCPADEPKCCGAGLVCVPDDDPATGCAADSCDPCPEYPNSSPGCYDGECSIGCTGGRLDCDGDMENGCEIDTKNDLAHCGGCDQPCTSPNGTVTCDDGSCVIDSCPAGLMDCNSTPSDGCEQDTLANLEHCGDCDSPCNGVCDEGQCKRINQLTLEEVVTNLDVSPTSKAPPCSLALAATNVVVATQSGLLSAPKGGGAPQTLHAGFVSTVAVDATDAYLSAGGSVLKVPLAGGAPTTLTADDASCLKLGATDVYYGSGGGIKKIAKSAVNGTPTVLVPDSSKGLAVDDTNVYYATNVGLGDDELRQVSVAGGAATTFLSTSSIWGIDSGSLHVYVARTFGLESILLDGSLTTTMASLDVAGGTIYPKGVATDDVHVYVPTYEFSPWGILRTTVGGNDDTVICDDQGRIGDVAVDGTHVYWIDVEAGAVRRCAK